MRKDYISITLIFLSVFIFYYARNGFINISGLLWAEDGTVFLLEVYRDGITSIFNQYAGYSLLYPRLVSLVVYFTDISFAPIIFLVACLIPIFMLITVTYRFVCSLGINYILSSFITITAFCVPLINEIYLNLTNIQWYIFILLFLVIIYEDSRSFLPKYVFYPIFAIFTLTGIFSIYLLCIVVLKIFLDRFKFKLDDIIIYCIVFVSSIVQITTLLLNSRIDSGDSNDLVSCLVFLRRLLTFGSNQFIVYIISLIFFSLLFVWVYKYIYRHRKVEKDIFSSYFIYIVFCISVYLLSLPFSVDISKLGALGGRSRYFFPLYYLVILLIPMITKNRKVIVSLLSLILFFWIAMFITSRAKDSEILYYFDYPKTEYQFSTYAKFAKAEKEVVIPINPSDNIGWHIDIGTKSSTIKSLEITTDTIILSNENLSVNINDMIKGSCLLTREFGIKLYMSSVGSTNSQVVLINSTSKETSPLKRLTFEGEAVYSIATDIDKYDTFQVIAYNNPITINKIEVFCLK